jgi:hypothetical protein
MAAKNSAISVFMPFVQHSYVRHFNSFLPTLLALVSGGLVTQLYADDTCESNADMAALRIALQRGDLQAAEARIGQLAWRCAGQPAFDRLWLELAHLGSDSHQDVIRSILYQDPGMAAGIPQVTGRRQAAFDVRLRLGVDDNPARGGSGALQLDKTDSSRAVRLQQAGSHRAFFTEAAFGAEMHWLQDGGQPSVVRLEAGAREYQGAGPDAAPDWQWLGISWRQAGQLKGLALEQRHRLGRWWLDGEGYLSQLEHELALEVDTGTLPGRTQLDLSGQWLLYDDRLAGRNIDRFRLGTGLSWSVQGLSVRADCDRDLMFHQAGAFAGRDSCGAAFETGLGKVGRSNFFGTGTARHLRWQAPGVVAGEHFFKSGKRRRDFHWSAGLGLRRSLPDNWSMEVFIQHQDNDSVLPVYTYRRNTAAFELEKRF